MKKSVISLVLPAIALVGLAAAAITPQTIEKKEAVVGRGLPPIKTQGLPPLSTDPRK